MVHNRPNKIVFYRFRAEKSRVRSLIGPDLGEVQKKITRIKYLILPNRFVFGQNTTNFYSEAVWVVRVLTKCKRFKRCLGQKFFITIENLRLFRNEVVPWRSGVEPVGTQRVIPRTRNEWVTCLPIWVTIVISETNLDRNYRKSGTTKKNYFKLFNLIRASTKKN